MSEKHTGIQSDDPALVSCTEVTTPEAVLAGSDDNDNGLDPEVRTTTATLEECTAAPKAADDLGLDGTDGDRHWQPPKSPSYTPRGKVDHGMSGVKKPVSRPKPPPGPIKR